MKPDPSYPAYLEQWRSLYEKNHYGESLAARIMRNSHKWAERRFAEDMQFRRVLEIGAGGGHHVACVRHRYDFYLLTDQLPIDVADIKRRFPQLSDRNIESKIEDALHLSFPDESFDRVIAANVLEHLYRPHEVLREWYRVLKPGGVLSVLLPCDPGVGWRIGRYASTRKQYMRDGLEYDYWMAREHVNPINNLVALIDYYFGNTVARFWYPFGIASIDLNLFYLANICK